MSQIIVFQKNKFDWFYSERDPVDEKKVDTVDASVELQQQNTTIDFTICMKSLSILRYISDAIEDIPLSALTRMLDTHDLPCLLIQVS